MHYYIKVLKNYTNFSGRARRKEYWMFVLFNIIFAFIAVAIDNVLGLTFGEYGGVGPVYILYILFILIPALAVAVRRLHDTSRSGWWILINFVPIIGGIWFLVLMVLDSTPGSNEYGPNPKEVPVGDASDILDAPST